MARYKLTLEYDGTNFVGWQRQENGLGVQRVLEQAVTAFCGETVNAFAAGRYQLDNQRVRTRVVGH